MRDEEGHWDGLQESSKDTRLEAHPQAARGGQAQHTCGPTAGEEEEEKIHGFNQARESMKKRRMTLQKSSRVYLEKTPSDSVGGQTVAGMEL